MKIKPITAATLRNRVEAANQAYTKAIDSVEASIEDRAIVIEARIAALETEANALATLGREIQ